VCGYQSQAQDQQYEQEAARPYREVPLEVQHLSFHDQHI